MSRVSEHPPGPRAPPVHPDPPHALLGYRGLARAACALGAAAELPNRCPSLTLEGNCLFLVFAGAGPRVTHGGIPHMVPNPGPSTPQSHRHHLLSSKGLQIPGAPATSSRELEQPLSPHTRCLVTSLPLPRGRLGRCRQMPTSSSALPKPLADRVQSSGSGVLRRAVWLWLGSRLEFRARLHEQHSSVGTASLGSLTCPCP